LGAAAQEASAVSTPLRGFEDEAVMYGSSLSAVVLSVGFPAWRAVLAAAWASFAA
jgi:hypothetical protein